MLKEVIKRFSPLRIYVAGTIALSIVSCGSNDKEKASDLFKQAQSALEAKDYAKVMDLSDSLKNTYPHEIEIRREMLHLSTRATEGLTLLKLQEADSLLAVLGVRGDSLQRLMKFVSNPIEGYYVAASANPDKFYKTTGIQGRVSPGGDFYLFSSLTAKKVNSTSLEVSLGNEKASTTTVNHDGERNDRSMGSEVITFMGVECDSVGNFINRHSTEPMTLTFIGSGSYSMPMSKAMAEEVALAYDYATTIRRFKVASLEKERLSRAVEISRSQAARTFVEKDSLSR